MAEFRLNVVRQIDRTEKILQQRDLFDEMEIADGTRIGNDKACQNPSRSNAARSRSRSSAVYSIQTSLRLRKPSNS